MKDTKLLSLGFDMPDDFPVEPYENVHSCLIKHNDTYSTQWRSFSLG